MSAKVLIEINGVNDPPSVQSFEIVIKEDEIIEFSALHFMSHFIDIDKDSLNNIKIINLPIHGTLKLLGSPVNTNQIISLSSLGNLTFLPE